ncbi:alkaline phosphatase family protein [uncultured Paludibaculum sp.]|uniref:bifunctional YncE family protein/alkaline phosphatase family protein n=1 Tax=uncultured Paludibaculum sp. TaxID=1765020 RepID=UPI002AAC32EC|nr:alkaline phosphatase family protein [uncultured Paludibaculum sp.]
MANFPRLTLLSASLLCAAAFAQTKERPVRAVTDPGVITTRQSITPAGIPLVFQGKLYGVSFGKDDSEIWVLNQTQLYEVDWRSGRILANLAHNATPAYQGLVTHQGKAYLAATPRRGNPGLFTPRGSQVETFAANLGKHNAGGLGLGGGVIVVPITAQNRAVAVDATTGKTLGEATTGIAPFAAVVSANGKAAFVSNWGGRVTKPGERTSPTGPAPDADRVLVDDRGVAASGTVTRLDLSTFQATATVPTGLHPNGMAWDESHARLYVANNNDDSVTVIDTGANHVLRQIKVQPFAGVPSGIAPTAAALSTDGKRLFVACGGINAVAVIDTASGHIDGLIPTGWYPSGLALSSDGKRLAITSMLGVGSGFAEKPERRFVHSYRGTVHVVDLPDAPQLASYTRAVADNNHLPLTSVAASAVPPNRTPKAVPERAGDASLIEHIVYIVKENRTYDQVLGDMPKGNGDPSLVMFGEDVTPNTHRLADQFVLLDNFYASGGNSADGHQWLAQANEVSYALWPGYAGRSYPFDGTDPLAIGRGGTIWDMARKLGKTVRLYGEYGGTLPEPPKSRLDYLNRWKNGEDFTSRFNIKPPSAHLTGILAANYPPYTNSIPDVIRSQIFQKDLRQWEQDGKMPNLTVMLINCDHTFGTTPETSTPKAMVADNDLALGQIVEALTKSKFWPKMAIFIVEDDAQNGVDHVDGHRTVALAVSPYTRRGHVDSTFYSHQSMLKTMELMLGLPALSLFDMIANEMRPSFTNQADLTAYTHVQPKQDLFEMNPPLKALRGQPKAAAVVSAKMRWDVPDAVPSGKLNQILWHSTRGWSTPFPGVKMSLFAPYSIDIDDDDR